MIPKMKKLTLLLSLLLATVVSVYAQDPVKT